MDLDLLLRLARPRTLIVIAAGIGVVGYGNWLARAPRQWYREWLYPPLKDDSGQGQDIVAALEKRRSEEVEARYRRVCALLAQAAAARLPVAGLQREADVALTLNRPGYRAEALLALSQVELQIPRKKEGYAPADPDQVDLDLPKAPAPVKASRRKKKRAA